jgi:hypothetical protein
MAPNQVLWSRRVRSGKESSRAGGVRKKTTSNVSAAETQPPPENPSDADALRKARLEHLEKPLEERRKKMKYVGEIVTKEPVTRKYVETVKKASEVRRRHKATTADTKRSHPKVRVTVRKIKKPDEGEFVYRRAPETEADNDNDPKTQDAGVTPVEPVAPVRSKTRRKLSVDDKQEPEEGRRPQRRQSEPLRRRNSHGTDECAPGQRFGIAHLNILPQLTESRTSAPRENVRPALPKSVASTHDRARPTLQRSTTSALPRPDVQLPRSNTAPEHARKASSIFSRFLAPTPRVPGKRISCLTCGSDDVLISRSAKLACSHRMCHECLRRIFTMSVTDPAHMPPRCCTSEHIPLKHVDELFDQAFKKTWNRKFQEYTTRNRIYCPARSCGEWIKPNHITVEHGRKVGKCKRCNTRVCCTCNNKMHTSRECPKDPATKEFVEIAKEKGWQRCYSCSAMVELKEGCNHMTCRCTAEFCMVCGCKWKSCDCPWFNYENVDAHLGNPIRYQEELDRRREQEQGDEALARRMQGLGAAEEDNGFIGVGNAGSHHMNDDFFQQARNILTGNFRQAVLAAEGLVNGTVNGRENPLPGLPLPHDPVTQLLRQQTQRGNGDIPLPAPFPRRQATFRRQNANPASGNRHAAGNRDGEMRIQSDISPAG